MVALRNFSPDNNSAPQRSVRKRDGRRIQLFDSSKIEHAVRRAFEACGLSDGGAVARVVQLVMENLPKGTVGIEQIQDEVELSLMQEHHYAVAKAYILYRHKRHEERMKRRSPDGAAIAEYTHFGKYARYRSDLGRREVYSETVARVEDMHLRRFEKFGPKLESEIRWAFDRVREKRCLPSMRSMQFGGAAIEKIHNRGYNCSFSLVDRPRVFQEAFYLLLCGSGVGYSVQIDHVSKLPRVARMDGRKVIHHTIEDTIEGWADSLGALIQAAFNGSYVEFNYSLIRPVGSPLKTSGGLAPGHLPLRTMLEAVRLVLGGAAGRKLRPIECHDILCLAADAVLSGGIRRSAMIALFSYEDSEMLLAKTGDWWKHSPWRARANNSAVIVRNRVERKQFQRIFDFIPEWGEPGFFFTNNPDYGVNPCSEIGLNPVLEITPEVLPLLSQSSCGCAVPVNLQIGEKFTGFGLCNLSEVNAAKFGSRTDFLEAARAAAIIGTLQADYTHMPYLGWVSEMIARREALLGIGITGMLDAPEIALNPEYQKAAAEMVMQANREIADIIGIRPAARTTCIKPSGTTSLELGAIASGHGPRHSKRQIRRVIANELEPAFQHFKSINPHMCIKKPDGDWVIEFPLEAPDGALTKDDVSALQFLEMVRSTQKNWVTTGTQRPDSSPGLTHNVSNTVVVKPDEWESVANYIWEHRDDFTGIALLQSTGDKDYAFAPNEAVRTEADESRWNQLIASFKPVDYTQIIEAEDSTSHTAEPACAGGSCQI